MGDTLNKLMQIRKYIETKQIAEGLVLADTFLNDKNIKNKIPFVLDKAQLMYLSEKYDNALNLFNDVLKADDTNVFAMDGKIKTLFQLKKYEELRKN